MTLVVKGYRDFVRACDRAGKETKLAVRSELKQGGDIVRREAERRFAPYDARTAAGYRVVVRLRGVAVEQSIRKTTGERPNYGARQMVKALVPARNAKESDVERSFSKATDRICDHFERS